MSHGLNESQKERKKGFDYNGKRKINKGGCKSPSKDKWLKRVTHKLERRVPIEMEEEKIKEDEEQN